MSVHNAFSGSVGPHSICHAAQLLEAVTQRDVVARIRADLAGVPFWLIWSHNGAIPNIQIKDVPEETHAVLRQRAAAAHQSLQEYLRARLIRDARQPTLDEVLERAGSRAGGTLPLADAVSALRSERARR